jgi:hypothetical protein
MFSDLLGKTLSAVVHTEDGIAFQIRGDDRWQLHGHRSHLSSVVLRDVVGDLSDLINAPIVMADMESKTNHDVIEDGDMGLTWTYYKLATRKGYVTISFRGDSLGGRYTENASFEIDV